MLDGAVAQEQLARDLAIRSAGRQESQDVELAAGESAVLGLRGRESP
jgi:hypothetical protein